MKRHGKQLKTNRKTVNGWLVLDKPVGISSAQAIGRLKFLIKPLKVGHAGTLDPMASGLLPVAFGEATKTVSFAMEGLKVYRFTVKWGEETSTDDAEGEVVSTSAKRPSVEEIENAIERFTGVISQMPPQYSAIKVDGRRAYEKAREGEHVNLREREVHVKWLKLVDSANEEYSVFETKCGKGTYVRSIGRDIARNLGTFGHVSELRRLSVGPFGEKDMIPLKLIEELANRSSEIEIDEISKLLQPIETVLDDIPALVLDRSDASKLRKGQAVLLRGRDASAANGLVGVKSAGTLVALAEVMQGMLHPKRVFNVNTNKM